MASPIAARPLWVAACLVALAFPAGARGAELTRVASSFDTGNPFDLDLSVGFVRTQRRGKITREWHDGTELINATELRYTAITQELPMRLAIGLFHDLEVHVGASLVFNHDQHWRYSSIVNDGNSTIYNNCVNADGSLVPGCAEGSGTPAPIVSGPLAGALSQEGARTYRAGLGNASVGLSWAPLSDDRDESKPKWTLAFDYTAPSAGVSKPWASPKSDDRGPIGDGAHRFHFTTALSKRLGAIDPYVKLSYSLPIASGRAISNCDNPGSVAGAPGNCNDGWSSTETGLKASHVGGLLFGAEFYPYDDPVRKQRVGIDLQLGAIYVSEGRSYNELSDLLGKLLYNDEYLTLGGSFGVYARPVEYVQLRLNASLYTDTEHFLTTESIGKDRDGNGGVSLQSNEVNPNFDFRYDLAGRRFRITEVTVFSVGVNAVANF